MKPPQAAELAQDGATGAIHAVMFVIAGFVLLQVFAILFQPLGVLWMAALASFGAGACANGVMLWRYGAPSQVAGPGGIGLVWRTGSGRELGLGFVLGAGSASLLLGGAALSGAATLENLSGEAAGSWLDFLSLGGVLLVGAAGEELLFRGYGFQALVGSLGIVPTLGVFNVVFAMAHAGNEDVTALGLLNTFLWGALFGYAWWRARSLYLPIAMHFGWNLMSPLFGVDLSGFTIKATGYVLTWHVDDLWSGGGYGPEGSLLTTLMVAVLFLLVRSAFQPPPR